MMTLESLDWSQAADLLHGSLEVGSWTALHESIHAKILKGEYSPALTEAQTNLQKLHDAGCQEGVAVLLVAEAECLSAFRNWRAAVGAATEGLLLAQRLSLRSLECYASFAVLPYAYLQLGESDKASEAAQHAYELCRQIVDRKMRAKTCMAVARVLQLVSSDASDAETCIREALVAFRALDDPVGEAAAQSSLAQVLVAQDACHEAVRPAREAVRLSSERGRCLAAAHEALVAALLGCNRVAEARQAAEGALSEVRQQGDKNGEAALLVALAQTLAAEKGASEEALSTLQEALKLRQQISLEMSAKVHLEASRLLCRSGMLDETLEHAQEALVSFRQARDWLGERSANVVLSEVYTRRGEPQLAPNRPEAMRLVKDMAQAVQERNADHYHSAAAKYASLAMSGAPVSTSEQREIFKGILQRDVGPSGDFIRANAVSTTSSTMAVGSTFKKAEKTAFYVHFRNSGIAYGPRYRAVDMAIGRSTPAKGDEFEAAAYAVYQIQEDAEDWERSLSSHPSLLDAALQSGSIIGLAQHL
ncbi:unnamed protein product [Symbiodinium natans]|uniref:PKS/mFAS DH domain-containing protein n=1 Tax=Symbiodinium natans TaxID=878477 RepID=A0A812GFV5_9DINO|nr:unnamed protein product [Symbiodinium natans]